VGEGVLEGLVKYRFRTLVCSIDGASPETYKKYRVGGDFEQVMEHIQRINHYKKEYQSEYPRLTWQFVVFGHNEAELPRARQRAAELDMKFQAKMSWDSDYAPIRNRAFVLEQTGWPAVTREEYEAVTGVPYMRQTCYSLWQYPNINWDGRILGCCWNSWKEFGGNAFEDGYVAAVNTENIRYARDMLLGKAEHRDDLPCSSCKLYLEMKISGNFLTKAEISNRWEHRVTRIIEYSRERLGLRKAPV
jgi:MoaA/NifB/PqqE/SkfB family radical SAM enzyme